LRGSGSNNSEVEQTAPHPATSRRRQGRRNRRENHERQTANRADAAIVASLAAEIETEIGKYGDGAGKRGGDGHGQCVPMLDVTKLMRKHVDKLVLAQPLEQAADCP
jgi:hypothetical protein